jgi:toxin ParE1/3/4
VTRRRVVTTRRADEDIDNAVSHYLAEGHDDAALAFVDELEKARRLLGEHPSFGSQRIAVQTGIPELRGLTLQQFPDIVLYSEDADVVRIHRLLHTSRDIPAAFEGWV